MADDQAARDAYEAKPQTADQAVRDLISDYPGVIVSVSNTLDKSFIRLHRRGTTWDLTLTRVPDAESDLPAVEL